MVPDEDIVEEARRQLQQVYNVNLMFTRLLYCGGPLSDYKSRAVYKRLLKLSLSHLTNNAISFLQCAANMHSV